MKTLVSTLLAALLGLSACGGGGGGACGAGNDRVPVIIEEDDDLDTFRVASVGVFEWNQLSGSDPGHTTTVKAFFEDFSDYRVQLAERLPFSEACFVYTGRQVTDGAPVPLGVERVTFGGLAGGELVMIPEPERIRPKVFAGRAFAADRIAVEVASAGGEADFPGFSDEIEVPPAPVLTRLGNCYEGGQYFNIDDPDLGAGLSLGIRTDRERPLYVEWQPGGGKYFELKILPGAGSETPWQKLRCITYDDGCLEVPAAALTYMAMDQATNFQLKVERHNWKLHSIKEGGSTRAAALLDASSWLEGTVGR